MQDKTMTTPTRNATLSIRLPADLLRLVRETARKQETSAGSLIRRALRVYLDQP